MVLTQGHTERWASSGRAPSEQKASGESAGLLWALSTPGCPPWRDVPGWCVGVQLYGCLTPPWGEQAVSARLFFLAQVKFLLKKHGSLVFIPLQCHLPVV